jgi:hypothetical protein
MPACRSTGRIHIGDFRPSRRIIDPLYLMALHAPPTDGVHVAITPFEKDTDFSGFRGFSYILPCRRE